MTSDFETEQAQLRNARGEPVCTGTVVSAAELAEAVPSPRDWGPWRLDTRTWVLYPVEPYRYEVDLEECLTSAEVLDKTFQIAQKTWADDALIAGLIRALDDVLHPQATLCSSGQHKTTTRARVRQMARQARAERKRALAMYGVAP
jgi:hypothetical protein